MPRNLLQDMVRAKSQVPIRKELKTRKEIKKDFEDFPIEASGNKSNSRFRIYFVALISIVFLLFALSFLFSGAKITITPKVKDIPLTNENLSAAKDAVDPDLSFDLVAISGEETKTIQGGEKKEVAIPATGIVILYNAFSSATQTLSADSKLEGSNGKIYKTSKKVIIPGMTKSGKPGSVEVDIYATSAGDEYNSSPLDFKIFSFKGTAKYSKFYARSKGDIIGGFKGISPVVSSLDKTTAVSELKSILETKLAKKATEQIPSGFILFKDATFLKIDDKDISFTPDKDNMVSVDVKGTLYGFLFDESKLTKKLAQDIIDKYDGNEIYIPNIRSLTFSLTDKESISFANI